METKIKRVLLDKTGNSPSSLAVFTYLANENPVKALDKVVKKYVGKNEFFEFVDANMDNPWTRVIVKEIEGFEKSEIDVEGRTFNLFKLYQKGSVEIFMLEYSKGLDKRPHPIMDFALFKLSKGRGYNHYIDSDISDIWSRLVIFGINNIQQEDFIDQKL